MQQVLGMLRDWRLYVVVGIFIFSIFYIVAFSSTKNFPEGTIITLRKGAGLSELAQELKEDGVVRSALWFRVAAITLGGETGIQAGDYYLKNRQNSFLLAWRMVEGKHGLTLVKMTIPEGFTVKDIANLFDERFPIFNKKIFLDTAKEGYMFPDTYFFPINVTAGGVIDFFENNFEAKIAQYENEILLSKHSEREVIIMASILEGEVRTPEDKALVAGILWKRLSIGMALQVDISPITYDEPGLPPKPVNNPGLISISAALNPKDSVYFYFLSDKEGNTHYAKTLEEHIKNTQKYL